MSTSPPPGEPPPIEPPDDDLDDIKAFSGDDGVVLAVKLDGVDVGHGDIEAFTLGRTYTQVDRLQRTLLAHSAGLEVGDRGRLKRPPGAAPLRAVMPVAASYGLRFATGPGESFVIGEGDEGETSATIRSVEKLVGLLSLSPDHLVEALNTLPPRVGRELLALFELLRDEKLTSTWRQRGERRSISITLSGNAEIAHVIGREDRREPRKLVVTGDFYRLDTRKSTFRIALDGLDKTISGTFAAPMLDDLRAALKHRVEATLSVTEFHYAYSSQPHRAEYDLLSVEQLPDED